MDIFNDGVKLFGAILSALIASRTIWAGGRAWYSKGLGSRRVWREKLNLMANGATAEYVENLLGKPVFTNDEPPGIWERGGDEQPWVDHIFSTPHAWVVTRRIGGRLEGWSVTITDPKFWWDVEDVTFKLAKGKLGRVTFDDLLAMPSGQYESSGARSFAYAESISFGNPGGYQSYIFMHNEEGVGKIQPSGRGDVRVGEFQRPDDRREFSEPSADSTRSGTTANTIIVTTYKLASLPQQTWQLWPIAASDQTRLLHRFDKKHGWRTKRSLGDGTGK